MWLSDVCQDTVLNKEKIFTLDIDWAPEFVLEDLYEILRMHPNVKFSIFHTHLSATIKKISNLGNVENGIHPNFNFLLQGDFRYGRNIEEVLNYYANMFPSCYIIRCHDLMHKTGLLNVLAERGYRYLSNIFIPASAGDIRPFVSFASDILNVPISFEDDEWLRRNEAEQSNKTAVISGVLNFHPVHIYLNSNSFSSYENCKQADFEEEYCRQQRDLNTALGVRDLFFKAIKND